MRRREWRQLKSVSLLLTQSILGIFLKTSDPNIIRSWYPEVISYNNSYKFITIYPLKNTLYICSALLIPRELDKFNDWLFKNKKFSEKILKICFSIFRKKSVLFR